LLCNARFLGVEADGYGHAAVAAQLAPPPPVAIAVEPKSFFTREENRESTFLSLLVSRLL
jgi:hypothetical protein